MWILLESSSINSYRLNYYGPKAVNEKGDSVFYNVDDHFSIFKDSLIPFQINVEKTPIYAIQFINDAYVNEGYRFLGFNEYFSYKQEKIKELPVFIVCNSKGSLPKPQSELNKFNSVPNLTFLALNDSSFKEMNRSYFKNKPYYIDEGYIALIDANRNIRGYYDGRYAAEIKRLTDEYKHLRLKEEKQKILKDNEIKAH